MISFEPTEEQELARTTVHAFAVEVLRPLARACDEESRVPDDFLDSAWALGLTSSQIPEAYGGGGAPRSPIMNALVLEALAYGDAALAVAATVPSLFAMAVLDHGTAAQRERYLPLFVGDRPSIASLALVEPQPAFDAFALRTTAARRGAAWVLNGTKRCVPLGDRATHFLVLARAADNGAGGAEAFIVSREAPGLTLSEPELNLGLRALPTATLGLGGVEVADADRLGGAQGCDARRIINAARVAQSALLVGLAHAVRDHAVPYAKERVAFGEAIARKQGIAFMLADMAIETDAMRWMVWRAASELEAGRDATRAAHLARQYVSEHALVIADNGVQVLGGHGFIRDNPVELWYRNARTLGVLEGLATV
jgi:alkylation response protein AidB-like acyl-CoA dehydrogenase